MCPCSNTHTGVIILINLAPCVHVSNTGVIILIQREAARILTSASSPDQADIRVVKAADIQRKLKTKNLLSTDANNNQVRIL
jgi:hypothetical protein